MPLCREGLGLTTVAIIPARYASTRFPGKPLAADTGKYLIQHVYERVADCESIDRAIGAGANRIESVDLRLRDDAEARRTALAAAVRDARAKAETIAEALGEELGPIVEANEGGVSVPPIVYREAAMGRVSAAAGTPVATGSVSVRASVTLRYRLARSG